MHNFFVTCERGAEGALRALTEQPAVVVSDLEMPTMDGFPLLRLLKANGELTLAHVPDEPGGVWLDLLVRTLRLDTGVRVELAGSHAEDWRGALGGQGVRAARMELGTHEGAGLHLTWLR